MKRRPGYGGGATDRNEPEHKPKLLSLVAADPQAARSSAVVIDLERYRMRHVLLACLRAAICHDCIGRRGPHACRWCALHPGRAP